MKRLLVGLGNPDDQYDRTRHNCGFWCIDRVALEIGITSWKKEKGALVAQSRLGDVSIVLLKPQQFMNRSGLAVRQVLDYYEIAAQEMLVALDDVYVAPGSARFRHEGGDGGHNGLKSILEHTDTDTFWRARIGVGVYEQHPEKRQHQPSLEDYVLQPLPNSDHKKVLALIDTITPNLLKWLEYGTLEEETVHI